MKRFILFLNLFLVFAGTLTAQTVTTIDALKTALVSGTEPTITLGADGLELNSVITTSRTVTLDLNNHTLSTDCQEGALTVTGGGNLTIKNGTLAGERGDFLTAKGGTINLESTLIVTGYSSIVWAYNGGVVNINGAKLHTTNTSVAGCTSGEYAAVSATNNGTIVVNEGSEVKADRKSALRCLTGGTITVNGGNIISEANGDSGDGAVLCSGGTYVINNGTFTTPNTETVKINSGSITVNGGTFTTCEICNVVFMKTNGTVTLKGGTYNRNVTPYVAQGYTCIQTGDVEWTVTQGLVQRTSGTTVTYYPTLKLAADASIAGDEIKLLADFTSTEVATFAFPVTLDLNGKTLTVSVDEGLTFANATTTTDSSYLISGNVVSAKNRVVYVTNANLSVKAIVGTNGLLSTNNNVYPNAVYADGENASVTICGGSSIGAKDGAAVYAANNAKVVMDGGSLESFNQNETSSYETMATLVVKGNGTTAVINGGTIYSQAGNALGVTAGGQATVEGGQISTGNLENYPAAFSEGSGSKIIVNGGKIIATNPSALTAAGGYVEINGGEITNESEDNWATVYAYQNTGVININGGTITGTTRAVQAGTSQNGNQMGTVNIKGGTIVANADNGIGVYARYKGYVTITNDSTDNTVTRPRIKGTTAVVKEANSIGTMTITGGTFSDDVVYDNDKYNPTYVNTVLFTTQKNIDEESLQILNLNQTWTIVKIEDMYVKRTTEDDVDYYYTTLAAANVEAQDNETLTLLKDLSEPGKVTFTKKLDIDLDEHILTLNVNEALTANQGADLAIYGGTINTDYEDNINANGAKVTISDLTINSKKAIVWAHNGAEFHIDDAVLNQNGGANYTSSPVFAEGAGTKLYIDGGETKITLDNASHVGVAISVKCGAEAFIEDGEFIAKNGLNVLQVYSKGCNVAGTKATITGGTFKQTYDVANWNYPALVVGANSSQTECTLIIDGDDVLIEGVEAGNGGIIAGQNGTLLFKNGTINCKNVGVMAHENSGKATISGGVIESSSNYSLYAGNTANNTTGTIVVENGTVDNEIVRPIISGVQAAGKANENSTVTITGGIFSDDVKNDADKYPTSFVADGLGTKVIIDEDYSRLENGYMWQVEALDTVLISGKTYNYFYIADTIRKPSTADDRGFTATLQSDGSDVLANVQLKEGHQVLAKGFDKGEYPMNLTADMFMAADPTPNQNVGAGPYAFKVVQDGKLIIKPRMLDYKFKENKGSKNYDGTVLVATYDDIEAVAHTEVGYGLAGNDHFTAGTLTTSDYIAGTYPCTIGQFQADGDLETIVEGFAIMNGDENKTGNYTPVFGKLALTINKLPITVTATDNKEYDELPFGPETEDGYTLTGSLADGDEITVEISENDEVCPGTYANAITNVTVNKTDDNNRDVTSSYAITKVNGSLTIDPLACEGTFTYEDYDYPLVLINGQCWFAENLRVAKEGATAYKEDAANLEKFGYLYDWATALDANGTKETDVCNGDFVQGICPQGWALPSNADFQALENYAHGVEAIKSDNANYWLLQYVGTDEYGFDERAGGFFKSALNRYEDLLTGAHFWTSESVLNPSIVTEGEAYSYCTAYYCTEFLPQIKSVNDKLSVRCIRKTPYENGEGGGTDPEPFTCGTSKMKDADNNEYETVLIGNQCWTKTNLRVAPAGATNETASGNYSETEAYYYVNPSVDASVYGYYYNWHAAMLACPAGWHLPTTEEWIIMEQSQTTMDVSGTEEEWYGDFAGKLVGGNDWYTSTESNAPGDYSYVDRNASGFSAVPAGYWWEVSYQGVGTRTDFWTSSEVGNFHWVHFLSTNESGVSRYTDIGSFGNSVRCVKD